MSVLAPTPALPPVRKPSVWRNMFGGFKINNTNNNSKRNEDEYMDVDEVSEKMDVSMSTAIDSVARPTLQQRSSSLAVKQVPRKVSKAASIKSNKTTASRAASVTSTFSRRSSSRKNTWGFSSSNPDDSDDAPPVPELDIRKFSFFSSHNPDNEELKSPLMPRSPSYVPRSAASSFLKTTTPLSKEEKTVVAAPEHIEKFAAAPEHREKAAHLKPIIITNVALRRDSQDGLEKHGMHSMAGICDIEEDISEEDYPRSPMSIASSCVSPTTIVFSHKRADTFLSANSPRPTRPFAHRIDSAKASPELHAIKQMHTAAIAELTA